MNVRDLVTQLIEFSPETEVHVQNVNAPEDGETTAVDNIATEDDGDTVVLYFNGPEGEEV